MKKRAVFICASIYLIALALLSLLIAYLLATWMSPILNLFVAAGLFYFFFTLKKDFATRASSLLLPAIVLITVAVLVVIFLPHRIRNYHSGSIIVNEQITDRKQ